MISCCCFYLSLNLEIFNFFNPQPKLKDGGSYIMNSHSSDGSGKTVVIFSPNDPNQAGCLAKTLKVFDDFKVNLTHIESRSSTRVEGKLMIKMAIIENYFLD
jgi:prephenate dehydratase